MKTVPLDETTLTVLELAKSVKDGPVIVTRNGQPLMADKDVSGSDWESVLLASNPRFMALIEESRRSYREKGGIRLDELRRALGLKKARRRTSAKKGQDP